MLILYCGAPVMLSDIAATALCSLRFNVALTQQTGASQSAEECFLKTRQKRLIINWEKIRIVHPISVLRSKHY